MELKKLGHLLEERHAQHDNNRKEVKDKLEEICSRIVEEADLLEEKISGDVRGAYEATEERILGIIGKLENQEEGTNIDQVLEEAQKELLNEHKYAIEKMNRKSFVDRYKLGILPREVNQKEEETGDSTTSNIVEFVISQLQELLERLHESMIEVNEELDELCNMKRNEAKELRERINEELEPVFNQEEKRIQKAVKMTNENINSTNADDLKEARLKGGMALVGIQTYSLEKSPFSNDYHIITTRGVSLEFIHFEERSPQCFTAQFLDKGYVTVSFSFFSEEEIEFLKPLKLRYELVLRLRRKTQSEDSETTFKILYRLGNKKPIIFSNIFSSTTYLLAGKITCSDSSTKWSDEAEFTTPDISKCGWKGCPDDIGPGKKYLVDEENPRIVTKSTKGNMTTIVGKMAMPSHGVTSWSIKILKSMYNNGHGIRVGVVSFDINQDTDYYNRPGWYFNCSNSSLIPEPKQKRKNSNAYWIKKKYGICVHNGDTVGVVMDTERGELSFVVNGVNLGVAFEGIPLDKPLVPCVILENEGDSVELDTFEVKENVDSSISAPSNITTKSGFTWDSITLTWDAVEGASFYKVELDDKIYYQDGTSNSFTKAELLPGTKHTFRIQTVKRGSVSEWSNPIVGKTHTETFETSWWKECPGDLNKKYSVDKENLRIATKISDFYDDDDDDDESNWCTIIGNTPLPLNKKASWSIKILKSRFNNGGEIYIGVAPSDINQNKSKLYMKCGWYFYCRNSALYSGPPHNYDGEEYGPRKLDGYYVHTGDSVGVIMDTTKGKKGKNVELSFVLNGMNLGVAYEGIPLDKPLVPCVILGWKGDSVEFNTSGVQDDATKVGSNINSSLKTPLNGKATSKLSAIVEGRTERSFIDKTWKECPSDVDKKKKYSFSKKNPRVAIKIGGDYGFCTIIGDHPLLLKETSSWSIKVLKSKKNDGNGIYVGVAPFDVNQNDGNNHRSCGWYYHCYNSTLVSGPPHNYKNQGYGPRRKDGQYVHTGAIIGVGMNTKKGELSFTVNGADLGGAYKGIPLDKPLVPCVILKYKDDSVELVFW